MSGILTLVCRQADSRSLLPVPGCRRPAVCLLRSPLRQPQQQPHHGAILLAESGRTRRSVSTVISLLARFVHSHQVLDLLYVFLRLLSVCSLRTQSPGFRSVVCVPSVFSLFARLIRTRSPGFRSAAHVRYNFTHVFSLLARFLHVHPFLGLLHMFPTHVFSLFTRFVHVHPF